MERLLFSNTASKSNPAPLFIIGHPRSGTTMLHYLLSADEKFVTPRTIQAVLPSTYGLLSPVLRPILKLFLPKSRPMDDMSLGPDEPKEEEFAMAAMTGSFADAYYFPKNLERCFREFVLFEKSESKERWKHSMLQFSNRILGRRRDKILLLKSPYNLARIPEILEIYPDARFIHIYRNPESVYRSNLKLYTTLLPLLSLQRISLDRVEDFLEWSYPLAYEKYYQSRALLRSDQIFEISYEDFVAHPEAGLENVYRKMNIELPDFKSDSLQLYLESMKNYRADSYRSKGEVKLPGSWLEIARKQGYA